MDETTKRKWTAEERRRLAAGEIDGAFAGPDQSFPIAGPADVADAWGLAGQASNPDQVRRRIISIARRFGWLDALPATAREWADARGIALKMGRRLSARQLTRLAEARQTIDELVRWASYEDQEDEDEDEDEEMAEPSTNGRTDKRMDEDGERMAEQDGGERKPAAGFDGAHPSRAVKALGNGRVGGYAVLWGDPSRKDLTGEYFTRQTQELDAIYQAMGRLPLLYHHGADGKMATTVVGPVDVMRPDDAGLWYEAQLTLAGEYRSAIEELIGQGLLGTSSGTLPAARRVDRRSGQITRWPIAELSLTPTPAEPRMMERPVAEVKAAFEALGLDAEWIGDDKAVGQPAGAGCADNRDYAPEAAKANEPEDGQPDDAEMAQIKATMIEMERLALLKLRR